MLSIPRLPSAVAGSVVPLTATIVGALILRRLLGAVVGVLAMFALGRVLLTALKADLALAERRTRNAPRR